MKLSKSVCVTPGMTNVTYKLEPNEDLTRLCRQIMANMKPRGAEAFFANGQKTKIRSLDCFDRAALLDITRFTCRVPSGGPDGSARITVDFLDRILRVTCGSFELPSITRPFRPQTPRRVKPHTYQSYATV